MASRMHFRKRLLMDYELETMFSLIIQQANTIEYPSSPSSINSPLKDELIQNSSVLFNTINALESPTYGVITPIKSSHGSFTKMLTENAASPKLSNDILMTPIKASENEFESSMIGNDSVTCHEASFRSSTPESPMFEIHCGQSMMESPHNDTNRSTIPSPPRKKGINMHCRQTMMESPHNDTNQSTIPSPPRKRGSNIISSISPSSTENSPPCNRSLLDKMYKNLKSEIESSMAPPHLVKTSSNDVEKSTPSFQMMINPTEVECEGNIFNQIGIDLSSIKSRLELERKRLLDHEYVQPKAVEVEVQTPKTIEPSTSIMEKPTDLDEFQILTSKIDAIFAFANYSNQRLEQLESSGIKIVFEDSPPSFKNEVRKYPIASPVNENEIIIGPNGTTIPKSNFLSLDWSRPVPTTTRKLLMAVFDRETLATHTLTGRPSPAFMEYNKPEKSRLDPAKIADIAYLMNLKNGALEREVRMTITTKCADECKMRKMRMEKMSKHTNKENDQRVRPY